MSKAAKAQATEASPCPCGGANYASCCGPLHAGHAAADAAALMRSRYSAYVLKLEPYLLATWHASTRPAALALAADTQTQWLGLKVGEHRAGGEQASVRFTARYKIGGRAHRMEEHSRFVREDGRWYYVDGDVSGT